MTCSVPFDTGPSESVPRPDFCVSVTFSPLTRRVTVPTTVLLDFATCADVTAENEGRSAVVALLGSLAEFADLVGNRRKIA
jgi:hypothetical protein